MVIPAASSAGYQARERQLRISRWPPSGRGRRAPCRPSAEAARSPRGPSRRAAPGVEPGGSCRRGSGRLSRTRAAPGAPGPAGQGRAAPGRSTPRPKARFGGDHHARRVQHVKFGRDHLDLVGAERGDLLRPGLRVLPDVGGRVAVEVLPADSGGERLPHRRGDPVARSRRELGPPGGHIGGGVLKLAERPAAEPCASSTAQAAPALVHRRRRCRSRHLRRPDPRTRDRMGSCAAVAVGEGSHSSWVADEVRQWFERGSQALPRAGRRRRVVPPNGFG